MVKAGETREGIERENRGREGLLSKGWTPLSYTA